MFGPAGSDGVVLFSIILTTVSNVSQIQTDRQSTLLIPGKFFCCSSIKSNTVTQNTIYRHEVKMVTPLFIIYRARIRGTEVLETPLYAMQSITTTSLSVAFHRVKSTPL